jgi:hypothetical protein
LKESPTWIEGHRFDLNRWGITVTELNRVLTYQKSTSWGATFMVRQLLVKKM